MSDLKSYIREAGVSQVSFAKELGVSPSYLSQILNGSKRPSLEVAAAIEVATKGSVTAVSFVVANGLPRPISESGVNA